MKFWNFIRRKQRKPEMVPGLSDEVEPGPGAFEFLITGNVDVPDEQFQEILVPKSLAAIVVEREGWTYYKVGEIEFSYSLEMPGIQMTFNPIATMADARSIADQVLLSLHKSGRDAELVILDKSRVYRSS